MNALWTDEAGKSHPYSVDCQRPFLNTFGEMLDMAVRGLRYEPEQFMGMFLKSRLLLQIEHGNIR